MRLTDQHAGYHRATGLDPMSQAERDAEARHEAAVAAHVDRTCGTDCPFLHSARKGAAA